MPTKAIVLPPHFFIFFDPLCHYNVPQLLRSISSPDYPLPTSASSLLNPLAASPYLIQGIRGQVGFSGFLLFWRTHKGFPIRIFLERAGPRLFCINFPPNKKSVVTETSLITTLFPESRSPEFQQLHTRTSCSVVSSHDEAATAAPTLTAGRRGR